MSAIVSANEAAHHFGLSEKTVRRWIKSCRLKADKSGRAYRVTLSEVAALIGPNTAHDGGPSADTVQTADTTSAPSTTNSRSAMFGIPELVALVDRLQVENLQLAEASAVWQEWARVLEEWLALAAPAESPVAAQEPPQPVEPTAAPE
jgi:excisionase family DNA binding protein